MKKETNNCKIDFFAYTFKGLNLRGIDEDISFYLDQLLPYLLPYRVYEYITIHNCSHSIKGTRGMGYNFRRCYDNIGVSIMCDGATDDHGIHIVLSGTILSLCNMDRESFAEFYEYTRFGLAALNDKLDKFFPRLSPFNIDFNLSRIDIAYDFNVPFQDFLTRYQLGCFERKSVKSVTYLDNDNRGTIYLGSRTSNCFIRIYDKALEIKEKNRKMLNLFCIDVADNHTRVEFEFKNSTNFKAAIQCFLAYINSDKDIGNFCIRFLKIHDFRCEPRDSGEEDIIIIDGLWDIYKTVILSNSKFENYIVSYDYSSKLYINLAYIQMIANLVITYCRQLPGLCDFLKEHYKPSNSALIKCSNISFDEILSYSESLVIENELSIIDYLLLMEEMKKERV